MVIWKTEEKQRGKNNDLHMGIRRAIRDPGPGLSVPFVALQAGKWFRLPPQIPDSPSIERHHFTTCKVPELPVRYASIQK